MVDSSPRTSCFMLRTVILRNSESKWINERFIVRVVEDALQSETSSNSTRLVLKVFFYEIRKSSFHSETETSECVSFVSFHKLRSVFCEAVAGRQWGPLIGDRWTVQLVFNILVLAKNPLSNFSRTTYSPTSFGSADGLDDLPARSRLPESRQSS